MVLVNVRIRSENVRVAPRLSGGCDCHVHVFDQSHFPFDASRSYSPGTASIGELETHLDRLGLDRVVLVQPSVYGSDNGCMLDAVERLGLRRARGVAVVETSASDREAPSRFAEEGIRGLRINLEATNGASGAGLGEAIERIEPLAEDLGLFVEIYADLGAIQTVASRLSRMKVPVVLDHFAGAKAERGLHQPGFSELKRLLSAGRTWVKLSAPYRASSHPAYDDLAELAQELIHLRPDRMLWASDWPHTGGGKERAARPRSEIEPFRDVDSAVALDTLRDWSGDSVRHRILVENPAELFGF